ncbi:cytochrome P450 4V2-like [Bacillus rossius redtenbacheri]|uniref:cytochrome P450 4V2-like n=1 Tax=Bacillus rossius redtenbacheri TaxID=93214 RepID=UPI002FDE320A
MARGRDLMGYLRRLRDRHGPACALWLGPHLLAVLADPEDLAVVFGSARALSKPVFYRPLTLVFGGSLIAADADAWRKSRRLMNPAFAARVVSGYASTFDAKSRAMADRLQLRCGGAPFDVADYTKLCALDMITETSLGAPADIQGGDGQHCVTRNMPRIARVLAHLFLRPWFWFTSVVKLTRWHRDLRELAEPIRDLVDGIVVQKTASHLNSSTKKSVGELDAEAPKQRPGFLEHMIAATADDPGLFAAEELRDQAMLIMGAGTDTTALTVAYALMLLGLHPDVQLKALAEQEDIFGGDAQRPVTAGDLKRMVYLEQVINETMRMYSVGPLVSRWADEDVRLREYTLPAGTTIIIPIYLVHRDPNYYPDPFKFDPDRFRKGVIRPQCSFIPFASGRRMCIGSHYAYMAMKTMLSVVLRRFEVLEYGSRDDMECLQYEFVLKMVKGHNIKLGPRKWEINNET